MMPSRLRSAGTPVREVYRRPPRDNLPVNENPSPCHSISLQAGWECPAGAAEETVWVRRFGRPPDFPAGDRLVLRVETVSRSLERLLLNGQEVPIPPGPAAVAHDVTRSLSARNQLQVHLRAGDGGSAPGRHRHRAPLPLAVARVWLEVYRAVEGGHA